MSGTQITTAQDICLYALKAAGVLGVGQTPLDEDLNDTFKTLNMMIGVWNRRRWLMFHLLDLSAPATGSQYYTVGPGMQFNVARPDRLEAAYFRQINTGITTVAPIGTDPAPGSIIYLDGYSNTALGADGFQAEAEMGIDYPLQILESREDYSRITLKNLETFSKWIFYDAAWPVGKVYPWPVLPVNFYELHILVKDVLTAFPNLSSPINLPPEYYEAIWSNLAMRLRLIYGRLTKPPPGQDAIEALAKSSLAAVRGANAAVARLIMPPAVWRRGRLYNVYSDTGYN